ncbi:berberine bridge enzyme-like 25 isoform X2 [Jatropha curcas]|uniref:berberine bridge enzyme-like 25 isoform X2 n=1 Tax=Jatropha curcas TaxID=180498 RepID=UPI0018936470|nr:berberine bridge enzyme-like 25 isoform X2 [Jatropha curcas]
MAISSSFVLPFLVITLLLSFSFTSTSGSVNESFVQCISSYLQHSNLNISQVVLTRNSSIYSSVLKSSIRNKRFLKTSTNTKPDFIITPFNESHIQVAILCAKASGMRIRARSAGHDYEGLSYSSDDKFVLIDLAHMRSIDVDLENEIAWVDSGATLGELYYNIGKKSNVYGFPAGSCPTVGVGGHISGGGFGTIFRKYGLAADVVIDAKLIDVNGRILDRNSMGEDLFWAIRGGGGASFGVIVSWKLRTSDIDGFFKAKSDYVVEPISQTGLEGLYKRLIEMETSMLILTPYGGIMSEISESEIPFPHRSGNLYKIQYIVTWDKEEETKKTLNWLRSLYSYMKPYVSKFPRAAYFNYRDLDIGRNYKNGNTSFAQASVWGLKYFKYNFKRLVQVKTAIDPSNFFWNEQSIPVFRKKQ